MYIFLVSHISQPLPKLKRKRDSRVCSSKRRDKRPISLLRRTGRKRKWRVLAMAECCITRCKNRSFVLYTVSTLCCRDHSSQNSIWPPSPPTLIARSVGWCSKLVLLPPTSFPRTLIMSLWTAISVSRLLFSFLLDFFCHNPDFYFVSEVKLGSCVGVWWIWVLNSPRTANDTDKSSYVLSEKFFLTQFLCRICWCFMWWINFFGVWIERFNRFFFYFGSL